LLPAILIGTDSTNNTLFLFLLYKKKYFFSFVLLSTLFVMGYAYSCVS
jgi:uncharacterized membrane protein YciS (DUF1049 family)